MGKAIILSDISFLDSNLGSVTPLENVPLQSLAINGDSAVIGMNKAAVYTVAYTPYTSYQRGVVWSIISGSQYATIGSDTGVLNILPGAAHSSITIQATSIYNSAVYATKVVDVSYQPANLWELAYLDEDFYPYMVGKSVLYQNQSEITKDGTQLGTAITQPITSLAQDIIVVIDFTSNVNVTASANAALFSRLADNFCVGTNGGSWCIGGTWSPTNVINILKGRNLLYIAYQKSDRTIYVKNVTTGNTYYFTNINGGGTLRTEAYLAGGAASTNNFIGTIHKVFIGGSAV